MRGAENRCSAHDALLDLAGRCADAGLELAVHAIGDAANRAVLDALAATRERWEPRGLRPRIEHAQLLHPTICPLRRARRDRIHAALPRTLRSSAGPVRLGRALRGRLRARLAGHERRGVVLRLRRADRAARPARGSAGGRDAGLAGRGGVEVERALDGFWSGAAHARQAERRLGRLLPGYAADLVVLERDPSPARRTRSRTSPSSRRWPAAAGCTAGRPGERSGASPGRRRAARLLRRERVRRGVTRIARVAGSDSRTIRPSSPNASPAASCSLGSGARRSRPP